MFAAIETLTFLLRLRATALALRASASSRGRGCGSTSNLDAKRQLIFGFVIRSSKGVEHVKDTGCQSVFV